MIEVKLRSRIQIYFKDNSRSVGHYNNVHQVLMTSERFVSLASGTQVVTVPYDEIEEIRVRFDGPNSSE